MLQVELRQMTAHEVEIKITLEKWPIVLVALSEPVAIKSLVF